MTNELDNQIETCEKIISCINDTKTAANRNDKQQAALNALNGLEYLTIQMRKFVSSLPTETARKQAEGVTLNVIRDAGYGIDYTDQGWPRFVLPPLLTQTMYKKHGNLEQLRGMVRGLVWDYVKRLSDGPPYLTDQVVIYKHVGTCQRDHDNTERKMILDEIGTFFLCDDNMMVIDVFECSVYSKDSFLAMYIVPKNYFALWLKKYKNQPERMLVPPENDIKKVSQNALCFN